MKTKDRIAVALCTIGLVVVSGLSKARGRLDQRLELAYSTEALITPLQNEFNAPAKNHLVRWLDGQIVDLNKSLRFFPFNRSSVQDAIDRLKRCKKKLNEDGKSNTTMQPKNARRILG